MVKIEPFDNLREEIVRRIIDTIHPRKIILFGSRARGTARLDSDVDLLIIADSPQPRYRRAAPLYGALSDILLPMDIVVYSPEEVMDWSEVPKAFVTTAIREGKILYEN
jgi:predicted nucleotidyltransferase